MHWLLSIEIKIKCALLELIECVSYVNYVFISIFSNAMLYYVYLYVYIYIFITVLLCIYIFLYLQTNDVFIKNYYSYYHKPKVWRDHLQVYPKSYPTELAKNLQMHPKIFVNAWNFVFVSKI